jgi:hypothetical protein
MSDQEEGEQEQGGKRIGREIGLSRAFCLQLSFMASEWTSNFGTLFVVEVGVSAEKFGSHEDCHLPHHRASR